MPKIDLDAHKLMYHPERVAEWYKKGDCYPIYVEIGPTNACNHNCVFCALDFLENSGKFINKGILLRALEDMGNHGVKSVMFAGEGEPFLHKDMPEFVEKAKESGMDISITTNGVPLTKEKIERCLPHLSWIRFSVDSGSSENHAKVHGTGLEDFERVIENIRVCVRVKKENDLNVTIGVQFLVIPQNIGESVKLAKILKEIGVDNLQIKPYSHHPQSLNNLVVNPGEYNKLEAELMNLNSENFRVIFRKATNERIIEGISYKECYGIPFFALIDANGNVIPCNLFYKGEDFTYGNLNDNLFSEIWEGRKRKEVLRKLINRGCEDCRNGCRLDVINRYLHRLLNPSEHDNFV